MTIADSVIGVLAIAEGALPYKKVDWPFERCFSLGLWVSHSPGLKKQARDETQPIVGDIVILPNPSFNLFTQYICIEKQNKQITLRKIYKYMPSIIYRGDRIYILDYVALSSKAFTCA